MSAPTASRGARVRFPFPPALFLGPLAVALLVDRRLLALPMPSSLATTAAGVALAAGGVAFSLSGAATVVRHRTTLAPHHPVSCLVTTGPFRVSRNPMYTGHAVLLAGAALWAGSWWPLLVAPLCMLATYRLVIAAEEAYLTDRFGPEYERYAARVRRWL